MYNLFIYHSMGGSHVILKEKARNKRELNIMWSLYLQAKRSVQILTYRNCILNRYYVSGGSTTDLKNTKRVSLKHVLLFYIINSKNLATAQAHRHEIHI